MKKIIGSFSIAYILIIMFSACGNDSKTTDTTDTSNTTTGTDGSINNNNTTGDTSNNSGSNSAAADMDFVQRVMMGNAAEIDAGKLAAKKGSTATVRAFGQMMVKDHTNSQQQLRSIASGGNLTMPKGDSIDAEHRDLKTRLQTLSGKRFDSAYMNSQVMDHQRTISLFETRAQQQTGNTQIRDFANTMLPHLKMHLQRADSIVRTMSSGNRNAVNK